MKTVLYNFKHVSAQIALLRIFLNQHNSESFQQLANRHCLSHQQLAKQSFIILVRENLFLIVAVRQ